MLFEYRRSLKSVLSLALLAHSIGFAFFLGLAIYHAFLREGASSMWFGKAVFATLILAMPIVARHLFRLSRGSGEWRIELSATELKWRVPDNIGEKNFDVPVASMRKIVCEPGRDADASDEYYIETVNGIRHHLKASTSGVDLTRLSKALGKMGVKLEVRRRS